MMYQQILTEVKENIFYITINREQKLNALNKDVLTELADAIKFAAQNDEILGVLLTGAGEKAFVAGADISEFQNYNLEEGKELAKVGQTNVFDAIENCPKPVVAAINGFALGGGLELAMACHIRIASENAKLGLPEVTLGLIPGYGGTQRLTQLVGKGRAIEMITTADMITADKAYKIGLVNEVVPQAELINKAEEILNRIKLRAPLAIASAIKAVNSSLKNDVKGFDVEIEEFAKCFQTEDFKEGVGAFLEKRKAIFKGK
ncbi:enoyl-CoA hydratase/isomerase family protein [Pedobacter boryungensis]|uniref:Enoyl-CoA hydratase/isomerase family protein n=1 Tax=Pedobacter boryungensis TaxID=869962 RepID=A0ABX2DBG7_9SPHI|nr:enoyl-CoA hydratase-related protein [Pedobacter boryungensis]NQX31411.1 enoyl-CoA hydratase/isomerase family protein [Pedobacter boryungensis]